MKIEQTLDIAPAVMTYHKIPLRCLQKSNQLPKIRSSLVILFPLIILRHVIRYIFQPGISGRVWCLSNYAAVLMMCPLKMCMPDASFDPAFPSSPVPIIPKFVAQLPIYRLLEVYLLLEFHRLFDTYTYIYTISIQNMYKDMICITSTILLLFVA